MLKIPRSAACRTMPRVMPGSCHRMNRPRSVNHTPASKIKSSTCGPHKTAVKTRTNAEKLIHSAQFISRYAHTARVSASAITVILFLIHASSSALSWYAISTRTAGALVFVISARRVVATVAHKVGGRVNFPQFIGNKLRRALPEALLTDNSTHPARAASRQI